MSISLTAGSYVKLFDGRVRGPLIAKPRSYSESTYHLSGLHDGDLGAGWTQSGQYRAITLIAENDRHVEAVLTLDEAISLSGYKPAELQPSEKPRWKHCADKTETLVPMNLTEQQAAFLTTWLQGAMQRETDMTAPSAPAAGFIPKTAFVLKPLYDEWLEAKRVLGRPFSKAAEDIFAAGYNAALRNESEISFCDSENAKGGLSESEHIQVDVPGAGVRHFPLGHFEVNGLDLHTLNPAYRQLFDAIAEVQGGTFTGVAVYGPKMLLSIKTKHVTYSFEIRFPEGAVCPPLITTNQPRPQPAKAAPMPEELARGMFDYVGLGDFDAKSEEVRAKWLKMATYAIEQLSAHHPDQWPATYKPGNHPAQVHAEVVEDVSDDRVGHLAC